jgi:hypothetical protein
MGEWLAPRLSVLDWAWNWSELPAATTEIDPPGENWEQKAFSGFQPTLRHLTPGISVTCIASVTLRAAMKA